MSASDPVDVTLASYQAAAGKYLQHDDELRPPLSTFVDTMIGRLAPGAVVLEIGSGSGRDAVYLENRGLRVVRTDATEAFLDLLRAAGHEARKLDVRSDPFGGPYDAVYASAVLLHLSRVQFRAALTRTREAVAPGGLFALTLKEGDGEAWSEAKLDLPRHFTYWRAPDVRAALIEAGWAVVSLDRIEGRTEPWLFAMAERPRAPVRLAAAR